MTFYQRYARLPIRFAALGLERGSEKSSYFCTPKGARVIGWAGVDGIHFCFVPGYGDAVFAVNPMAAGNYVQIVSRNFEDFLRLLLACGGSAAIEQAGDWSRERFEEFVADDKAEDPARRDALAAIAGLGVQPMDDPYGYLMTVRQEMDCAALQPKETAPPAECGPFPVVWNSSIHGRPRRRRPAKELAVNAAFRWGEEEWHVPALYVCAEGVMVDYCVGVEPVRVKEFLSYYTDLCGGLDVEPTEEQRDELERRNPLHIAFRSVLTVDGRELPAKSGSSTFWVPESCGSEELTSENRRTRDILDRYGLDESKAWVFWRSSYPWKMRRGCAVKAAALRLVRDKVNVTVGHFTDPQPGEEIPFAHPVTGAQHVLRVLEVEAQTLSENRFTHDPGTGYPDRFTALTALVEPPMENVMVFDCAENDPPRGSNNCAMGVAIIGRKSDAPAPQGQQTVHAVSAMHFVPPESVTWRITVPVKPVEDRETVLRTGENACDTM